MNDQNFQKGAEAYIRGDHETAHREFLTIAEQGSARAQFSLGWMYANGEGVQKNDAEAVYWFCKAAEQGLARAQGNLGARYANGEGIQKNDAKAVYWFCKAAEQGLAWAQFNLGAMYASGRGVQKDDVEAMYWHRKAAKQGYARAQFNLGVIYANGLGVQKDEAEAVGWYRKSAKQGHATAQFNLGVVYASGEGVQKNDAEAVRWYRKSAEQGYANAQSNLGAMYANGRGIQKDNAEAMRWYRKAAEQGYATAQFNLGLMYTNSEGSSRDYIDAYKWLNLAATQGDEQAVTVLDSLQRNMSPSQITQALARTREWSPISGLDAHGDDEKRHSVALRETAPWIISASPDNIGSGFFVSAEHILTNNHVVEGYSRFRISLNDGDAVVRARDPANDLALLQLLRSSPGRCEQPAVLRSEGARQGENVVAAGYPLHDLLRGGMKVTQGIVSALSGVNGDTRHLQITAPVQKGNSGGPLLDGSGHVLGVVVEALPTPLGGNTPQNVNFAIRAEIVRVFLDAYYVPYQTAHPSTDHSTEQIAAKARACTVRIECWEERPETGKY